MPAARASRRSACRRVNMTRRTFAISCPAANRLREIEPVHSRQSEIDNGDVVRRVARGRLREEIERLLGVAATRLLMPQLLICETRMPWLMAVDSTISARTPVSMPIGTAEGSSCHCVSRFSKSAVKRNVEPAPTADSTWIVPPIISTSCLLMARPRPE